MGLFCYLHWKRGGIGVDCVGFYPSPPSLPPRGSLEFYDMQIARRPDNYWVLIGRRKCFRFNLIGQSEIEPQVLGDL